MAETDHASAPHAFDRAIALTRREENQFEGHTSDDFWNFTGPFGGVTAASLLNAVMLHDKRIGTPVAMTVNYCAPVAKGAYTITVREVRTNRSTQHWYIELSQPADGVSITSTAVFAARRETWSHVPGEMPKAAPPESLLKLPTRGLMEWMQYYDFRFAKNMPVPPRPEPADDDLGPALSHVWVKMQPERPLDFLSLMAISDTFFGRIFHVRKSLIRIGTISMTTYFHVDADEIAGAGSGYLFGTADANVFNKGYSDQIAAMWSRAGKLLATSQQLVYFRA
jgi:acyl-CoA thioesterase